MFKNLCNGFITFPKKSILRSSKLGQVRVSVLLVLLDQIIHDRVVESSPQSWVSLARSQNAVIDRQKGKLPPTMTLIFFV